MEIERGNNLKLESVNLQLNQDIEKAKTEKSKLETEINFQKMKVKNAQKLESEKKDEAKKLNKQLEKEKEENTRLKIIESKSIKQDQEMKKLCRCRLDNEKSSTLKELESKIQSLEKSNQANEVEKKEIKELEHDLELAKAENSQLNSKLNEAVDAFESQVCVVFFLHFDFFAKNDKF